MNEVVRTDIIRVFADCIRMIDDNDISGLRAISDHVIHNASIFQDEDSVACAVIIYAISKIYEQDGKVNNQISNNLRKVRDTLEKNDLVRYKENMQSLYKNISSVDSKIHKYVDEVIEKARVKKGSKIYDHGISMSQSAQVLGTSIWELMNYVGKTRISDSYDEGVSIKKRLETARSLFLGDNKR